MVFNKFKNLILLLSSAFIIIISATLYLPASNSSADIKIVKSEAIKNVENQLLIGGTGASLGGMQLIASAFMEKNPQYKIRILPSLGSGGGIKALADNRIQLAISARPLKEKEKKQNLYAHKYADTPLMIASNEKNDVTNLTTSELVDLYSGKVPNWSNGLPVRIIRRPQTESDVKMLQTISSEMSVTLEAVMKLNNLPIAFNDQENANLLESLPGSIGAITLAQLLSEKRKIKEIRLNGISATVENLANGSFRYLKSFYLILPTQQTPLLKLFTGFILSDEGQQILHENGHLVIVKQGA